MGTSAVVKRQVSRIILAMALALGGAGFLMTSSASASAPPIPKVTGGVELSTPLQYADFSAFQSTPAKGSITYTNFEYASPGTGVWNWSNTQGTYNPVTLDFYMLNAHWLHTMTITSIDATSPNSLQFSATGVFNPNPGYTWTATGTITGSTVNINLLYTGLQAGSTYSLTGQIASDGSISGTATGANTGTWSSPPGTVFEVLAFTSPVTCAIVNDSNSPGTATFGYTVPAGLSIPTWNVLVAVSDGGSPGAGNDTWAHGVAATFGDCGESIGMTNYPVVGGNLVVH